MKQSLLLYVAILALLFNVFTYAFFSKQADVDKEKLEKSTNKYKDSLSIANEKLLAANYFSLENNENAINYLESSFAKPVDYKKLIPVLTDTLLDYNTKPQGNPYTGQDQITENKFIINKIKVLNHRWIIADFSDGTYWGEVLIKYFINDDQSISFEVSQSLLYQKTLME